MRRNQSSRTLVILFNHSQASIGRDSTPQSLYYCLFAPHIYGVLLRAHPVRGESHNPRNANGVVATASACSYPEQNSVVYQFSMINQTLCIM